MIARCSAASRVPVGGSAALDAACAPCVGCTLIAGHHAHALALHVESASYRLVRLLHLEHVGPSLTSMPAPRRACENAGCLPAAVDDKGPSGCSSDSSRVRTVTAIARSVGLVDRTCSPKRWPVMPPALESILNTVATTVVGIATSLTRSRHLGRIDRSRTLARGTPVACAWRSHRAHTKRAIPHDHLVRDRA